MRPVRSRAGARAGERSGGAACPRAAAHSHADPAAEAPNRFFVWSAPIGQPVRITGTPRISLEIEGYGNVMVDLYDVAPYGSAVIFNQQVAVVKPGTTSFELRSTDWTLPVGHTLAVEIGTIQPGFASANDWVDTPSYETIIVRDARLEIALDDPANDTPTPGDPAPRLELHRQLFTEKLSLHSSQCNWLHSKR